MKTALAIVNSRGTVRDMFVCKIAFHKVEMVRARERHAVEIETIKKKIVDAELRLEQLPVAVSEMYLDDLEKIFDFSRESRKT